MGTKRKVIEVPGLGHGDNPIPVGTVMNGMLFTGTVSGVDRATGTFPEDKREEIANAFANLGAVLDASGASWDTIVNVHVALQDRSDRPLVNEVWVQYFPDEHSRPTRHTSGGALPGDMNIQIQIVAFVED